MVVNRNRMLREGIRALIDTMPDLTLEGSFDGTGDPVMHFLDIRPDVTLMDLDLASNQGLEAVRRIIEIDPGAAIIGLVTHDQDNLVRAAIDAGAAAVLTKDLIRELLVPVIRTGRRTEDGYEIPVAVPL